MLFAAAALGFASCEDYPDAFVLEDGVPTVHYVRYADREVLIDQAYMGEIVCFVGENLCSVRELYFNEHPAVLNTSYMTANTLIAAVPGKLPQIKTDKVYMITKNKDTVTVDFKVMMPAPQVKSMSYEYAAPGEEITIYGDYFSSPLTIDFVGKTVTDADYTINVSKTALTLNVPEGAGSGPIKVTTESGVGQSSFHYMDSRNILFDWDGSRGGMSEGWGWRSGAALIHTDDPYKGDGSYLMFGGKPLSGAIGGSWEEDNYCVNYWPDPAGGKPELSSLPEFAEYIDAYGVSGLQVKFEVLVPTSNPWSSCALQIIFSGNQHVTYATAGNSFYSDASLPRGLWIPWLETGSYDTAGKWQTVGIPFSAFTQDHENKGSSGSFSADCLTGLTLFVWHGGVAGTDCEPIICLDNIRVVPLK